MYLRFNQCDETEEVRLAAERTISRGRECHLVISIDRLFRVGLIVVNLRRRLQAYSRICIARLPDRSLLRSFDLAEPCYNTG